MLGPVIMLDMLLVMVAMEHVRSCPVNDQLSMLKVKYVFSPSSMQ